ncbi:hypothetical protein OZ411_01220 [Bradyrhizobium sp. Arg237L]|uniref:hypothetical protein n=1 Tax=Bradyrhizobium sp. Arg237L TaxID=3003352 RepID=UPI00249E2AB4|nr:hypothetical protein [Bradyrhizobium sp. Arg237L]MDI4231433.1 hypothetical protein [Bradyrhizobium sp. Arg237L]
MQQVGENSEKGRRELGEESQEKGDTRREKVRENHNDFRVGVSDRHQFGNSQTDAVQKPGAEVMTPRLTQICADLGIQIIPTTKRRGVGETCAVRTMERILAEYGPAHLTIVLRSIVETENNGLELVAPTMWAISDIVLAHPTWTATTDWLDAMDRADLSDMRARAKANRRAAQPRPAIATMLYAHLSQTFDLNDQGKLL